MQRVASVAIATIFSAASVLIHAAPFTISYSAALDYDASIPYTDIIPGQPPSSGVSPSYFAPLQKLHSALLPLLQKVEVEVSATNTNRINLTNQAPIDRTLSYSLTENMTLQLADLTLPAIGPVSSTPINNNGSLVVPFNFSTTLNGLPGSTLAHLASFTGSQAQQFGGSGTFGLEFFDTQTFSVSATPDAPGHRENGSALSKLSGSATVTYTLAQPVAPIALTFIATLDSNASVNYDNSVPGAPPVDVVTPSYFAPLPLLPAGLGSLLQKVEIGALAQNTNTVSLVNATPVQRTLTYSAQESITMQLAAAPFPPVGPASSAPFGFGNSRNVPSFFTHIEFPVTGSTLDEVVTFIGGPASQFVGDGMFDLEFFDTLSLSVSGDPDPVGFSEKGSIRAQLDGTAYVTYYLDSTPANVPLPSTLPLILVGTLALSFSAGVVRLTR